MPANAQVFVHYGPYESCAGIVGHSTHRLEGMKNILQEDGHTVSLVEIYDRNSVELYVNGEQIFKCDIRELDFGGDGKLDRLCAEALKQVRTAF